MYEEDDSMMLQGRSGRLRQEPWKEAVMGTVGGCHRQRDRKCEGLEENAKSPRKLVYMERGREGGRGS